MESVKVKLYGLFSVTRRGYLLQLTMAAFLLIGLLVIRSYLPPLPAEQTGRLPASSHWVWWILHKLPWIVLAIAVLYGVEAVIVLRQFARKEALQKPSSPEPLQAPKP